MAAAAAAPGRALADREPRRPPASGSNGVSRELDADGRGGPAARPSPPRFFFRVLGPRGSPHPAVTVQFQAATQCGVSGELVPELREYFGSTEPEGAGDVQYQCVHCSIQTGEENITVAAELSLDTSPQFLKSRTALLIPGKITFNRELYLGLKEENHKAEIALVFLEDEVFDPLPVILKSCAGGLVLLALIILLLWKCGFFKRKYKAKMEQEDSS